MSQVPSVKHDIFAHSDCDMSLIDLEASFCG